MIKIWLLSFLLFLLAPSAQFAQTPRAGKTSKTGETRYFLRLFNCDDGCTAQLNDGTTYSAGFAEDTGWMDITSALRTGQNGVEFSVHNEGGGIAYGFQIRKNNTTFFEQICGRAGTVGCDNNRTYPRGVAKQFSVEFENFPIVSRAEMEKANSSWLAFYAAFRAAVKKRDQAALRGMIASPFLTQSDGELNSPDEVIKWLDESKLWQELQREVATGVSAVSAGGFMIRGRPTRCAKGIFCFEFGRDGKWRLAAQVENEGN